jgi:peptidylprolyl isomerase
MSKKWCVFILVIILGISSATGCAGKEGLPMAKDGDTVKVHYKGTLGDGTVFDTSRGGEPLEFTLGAGNVIAGFDKAVNGMRAGEIETVTIPAEEAYGPRRDELVLIIGRDELPENLAPSIGQQLQMSQPDGRTAIFVVTGVSEESITVDGNHPMAGKDLTFEIELVDIK